ncbi:carbohydrate ABC transporter substrate-binding protein [Natronosporangium hydrolyticum]|uniref:Carbohydrate ABC transporter substrate-binding protein n=1 Tax=Natronosporangium hydrolyticum TaxID=2811111 RepID=A0A895YDX8_9ACTN|nr:ABC transporter substrate-binding protein [Natronosporangium hydrolyticum]QSB15781.1 carbohydrate ABC transporter substrate-binding protein [Natronosporangium hydrolyticum]
MRRSMRFGRQSVVVGFALALVASGCGDSGGDDTTVTLQFSWWGSDSRHDETQQIIDAFEAANPDIRINGDFTDWNSYWDRLATATAGGRPPDIITQEERFVSEYVANNQLLDLNTLPDDALDLNHLDEAALAAGEIGDGLYAIATGVNAFTIVADPEIFDEAGVELPDDTTWTWQDYLDLSVEISESGAGYGAQVFGTNEAGFNAYARQRGESLYQADGGLGFSAETLAEWWTLSLDQTLLGGAPEATESVEIGSSGPDQSLLATNDGAMGFWWTNQLGALAGAAGRDLVLLRQPGEADGQRPGMYLKPAMFYSISANTDHPEEAARFVDYLLNSAEAAEIMLTDRGLPANLEVREAIQPLLPETEQQVSEFLAEITPELADPPPPPPTGAGEAVDIMQRLHEEVLFERMTPIEAAEQFMQELEAATS